MYYVSCKDGDRYSLLLGPFDTHEEALENVDEAKRMAQEIDCWACFYAFGTCRVPPGYALPGKLNHMMEEVM